MLSLSHSLLTVTSGRVDIMRFSDSEVRQPDLSVPLSQGLPADALSTLEVKKWGKVDKEIDHSTVF